MELKEIQEYVKEQLSEKRYNHSVGVMERSEELAKMYGADVETAKKIGIILSGYMNVNSEDKREIEHMVKLIVESTFKILKENRNANKLIEKEKKQKNK